MAPLISPLSLAPSLSLLLFSFSLALDGKALYERYCASCHGENRLGKTGPPLIPQTLIGKEDSYLLRVIRRGVPASSMPGFDLSENQIRMIVEYIKSPVSEVRYGVSDIRNSRSVLNRPPAAYSIRDPKNLVVFVDKGKGEVVLLEGEKVLDSFKFGNVHGGVKFSEEGFYVPSRDGWVAFYSLKEKRPKYRVRPCVYLRNIAVQRGRIAAACTLPKTVVLLNSDLDPVKVVPLQGRPAAVYPYGRGYIVAFRDLAKVALLDYEGNISYVPIDTSLDDFFIDPLERYLVGGSRGEGKILVYSLPDLSRVAELRIRSLPHLFSVAFWYADGSFFFATRHIGSDIVTVWRMYSWRKVKEIKVGSGGFFVRTHPSTPYLWVDGGDGHLVLIDKRSFEVTRKRLAHWGRLTHVEFSGDGRFAYLSLSGNGLFILDTQLFREVAFMKTSKPAGKYNPVMKTRRGSAALLGYQVFMNKCWGCHHTTRQAFGPPMRWIATHRDKDLIVAQILNPEGTSRLLGYARNNMPRIRMSPEEVEAILRFMEFLKEEPAR